MELGSRSKKVEFGGRLGGGKANEQGIRERGTGQIRGKVKEGENGIGMVDSGSLSS
jgi:hypothetical protein